MKVKNDLQRRVTRRDQLDLTFRASTSTFPNEIIDISDSSSKIARRYRRKERSSWRNANMIWFPFLLHLPKKLLTIQDRRYPLSRPKIIANVDQPQSDRFSIPMFNVYVEVRVRIRRAIEELKCGRARDEHLIVRLEITKVTNFDWREIAL